jgi:hypothetical protein
MPFEIGKDAVTPLGAQAIEPLLEEILVIHRPRFPVGGQSSRGAAMSPWGGVSRRHRLAAETNLYTIVPWMH